jgi:hypothetical protein
MSALKAGARFNFASAKLQKFCQIDKSLRHFFAFLYKITYRQRKKEQIYAIN